MVSDVSEGVGCDINLCRSCDMVKDLQEVHRPNTCVVILSMFGKNPLALNSALVCHGLCSLKRFDKLKIGLSGFLVKSNHRQCSLLGNP